MRILQFESTGGASGDMILGVLMDLGITQEILHAQLGNLVEEEFEIAVSNACYDGLRGKRVEIEVSKHKHGAHIHRNINDIREIVEKSGLPRDVRQMSMKVFERLAGAEARVHGTSVEDVHFHEVGAVDSIVDIVGSCLGLTILGVDGVAVSVLPLGTGKTECSHGSIPIPAPATAELLKGHATVQTDEPFELVTPTGAALLTTWKAEMPAAWREFAENGDAKESTDGALQVMKMGRAFGRRTLNGRPNVLAGRMMAGDQRSETDN